MGVELVGSELSRDKVSLDDKYVLEEGTVFITGVQALVRLPLEQKRLDRAAGLNTGGFISGYRGSPLGTYDSQLWKAQKYLDSHDIVFKPGVNEELGATAVWGSQQVNLYQGANFDGVFGIWYGKGPGVDRCGDVFKHANMAGTSPNGGVLAFAGDDHACKSSTLPNQSEFAFIDAEMPVLNPTGVEELLEFGLKGFALSRYSGCWVGMKTIADTMDSSATITINPALYGTVLPEGVVMPPQGLNILLHDTPQNLEDRHRHFRLPAAQAFARVNGFDRIALDTARPRRGIMATGKAYLHVRQALRNLGIDEAMAEKLGLRVYKVGMTWPLEPSGALAFADGLEEVLVVEERRDVMEHQLRAMLYNLPDGRRPRIVGKRDDQDRPLLRDVLDLDAAQVAKAIYARLDPSERTGHMDDYIAWISQDVGVPEKITPLHTRSPYFCSGCPHNTSTNLPDGSRATAGIGCHFLVQWMDRKSEACTQMGGEGVPWVGQAPFTGEKHIFANLGDGTYFHSGILAIRQALGAKVNITYKILYNDAVAMTGGQQVDGVLTVPQLATQLAGEGVARIALVSDDPDRYRDHPDMPARVTYDHRSRLEAVQKDLREHEGVSVLIYDQTCATEKRRRRKRGLMEKSNRRIFINDLVCEGCGDCTVKSNCLSVEPVETEWGRKRRIDQSSCNQDFSCVEGFCPSFVSVEGGQLRKASADVDESRLKALPDPELPEIADDGFNILLTGIGGQGVTALGAMIGMAAHVDGQTVAMVDMLGMAQKGGGVHSNIRIGKPGQELNGPRIAVGGADLILAADIVGAAGKVTLPVAGRHRAHAIVNADLIPTAEFIKDKAVSFDYDGMLSMLGRECRVLEELPASRLATRLMGDAIYTNMLLLGFAWQKGRLPMSRAALEKAITLNGVAVERNLKAFNWGRLFAHDARAVEDFLEGGKSLARTLDEVIDRRAAFLTDYQDAAYAARYKSHLDRVRKAEQDMAPGSTALSEAVARNLFKLMAYKDEYEVARLYTDGQFEKNLRAQFEGDFKLSFHMAPPILARTDPDTGLPRKRRFGGWMKPVMKVLARGKGLRGSAFDPFGYTAERKSERALISDYENLLDEIVTNLTPERFDIAIDLAGLPADVRGFGHVKDAHIKEMGTRKTALMERWSTVRATTIAAE
jgi:indolepyruvate ferredoxin oxidoreductase